MSYQPRRPTWSLVEPPPAVEVAADLVRLAVDALEAPLDLTLSAKERGHAKRRQLGVAHAYARAIDWTAFEWFWLEGGLEWERRHDKTVHTTFAGQKPPTAVSLDVKRAVVSRDGWRCRYCRIRVVSSATLTALERRLPAALPMWPAEMGPAEIVSHAAQCVLRLTWDHVIPRSAGGLNVIDNIVAACGTCNFTKGSCTIEELSLRDPRVRDPLPPDGWDGLIGRLGSRHL